MRITSRFTIAVHMITAIDYFQGTATVTSGFLAGSVGANPVIVRSIMGRLKEAGILHIRRGQRGMTLAKPLAEITFLDVYQALDCPHEDGLFHFHEKPNANCPVGRHIHAAMEQSLRQVQRAMENEMRRITLADIVQGVRREMQSDDNMEE